MAQKILLLHDEGPPPEGLAELAAQARAGGAEVTVRPCAEPYGAVLDAVAGADKVVYYR